MQKARRHPNKGLRPLVSVWFQVLLTPVSRVLFTFPSRYLFTIGLSMVFSLGRWCCRFHRGFLRSPTTQECTSIINIYLYVALTLFGSASQQILLILIIDYVHPTTPQMPKHSRFGLIPFRSPLLRESLLFSLPTPT